MIRTLISDLGNVLLHFDHMHACRELAKLCTWSPERIYTSMFESDLVRDYESGRISSSAFALRCAERLDLDLGLDEIRHIWSDIFHPVEGMEKLIRALRGRCTLVLLSNTNEWHFEHCRERFPVVRLFDHYALSYRLGCRKPDPAIYSKALAMADAVPEETLYVDDIPAFVDCGKRLGLKAIRFQDTAQLTEAIRAEGLTCP
jgi:glucose-1-phosphatase